ncbi:hypothetical protein FB446DRAFT_384082 [Lentinula raphanica]|nr:hypothetical protein FB446DRAFT_384082 [Lentinula raphanica]
MTMSQMAIPFGPFEVSTSIDPTLPIPPNHNIPTPSLAAAACSDSTSPTVTVSLNENESMTPPSTQADLPLPTPLDPEPARDLPPQPRSPHLKVSSLALSRRSRHRHVRVQVPTPVSQEDHYPAQVLEDLSVDMETPSLPSDITGPRYQPYQVPGARMGSGSRHPRRVDLTSGQDPEVGLRKGRMSTDQEQHQQWGQEQSIQDLAWVTAGKTTVQMGTHPSLSTPLHSAHLAVENADFQPSMRETEREPVNLDHSQGDLASWNSALQTAYPDDQNHPLAPQRLEEYYSPPSGNHTLQQPLGADREQVAQDSLSVERQDSTLEIERMVQLNQYRRAMNYSHELRLQQEAQLRRIREKVQMPQSMPQPLRPSLQSPHHPDQLQQYRHHSQPMPLDPQPPILADQLAHLTPQLNRNDRGMDIAIMRGIAPVQDIGNLVLSAGEVGQDMEPHSQVPENTAPNMVSPPGHLAQMLPPAPQQVPVHHYPQEVYHHRAPSQQQASMPGDDYGVLTQIGMASDNNLYGNRSMFNHGSSNETSLNYRREGVDAAGDYSSVGVDGNGQHISDVRGWGTSQSQVWGKDYSLGRFNLQDSQ